MATFSEVNITFLDAFDVTAAFNKLNILYSINGVISAIQQIPVVSRSGTGEFSQGSDATTQAQFYKDALDLDIVPSLDWEVTILGAVVTVKSTNPLVIFENVLATAPNDTRITTELVNDINGIADTTGLLLARSNYYLSSTITTELFIEVQMYFRKGNNTLPFATPNYIKKVNKPSVNWEYFDVLISRFALDFIEPKPVFALATGIIDSDIDSLVSTTITTTTDQLTVPTESIKNLITTKGYSSYSNGANYLDTTSELLLSSTVNQVQKDGFLIIPFVNNGQLLRLSDAEGGIVSDLQATVSFESNRQIQYAIYDLTGLTTEYVTIVDAFDNTYTFEIIDECKYTPQAVSFLNSFGVFEELTFFKAKRESVEFKSEGEYKNNFVLGGAYDTSRHLYRSGNKNARESVKLNTGYLQQEQNKVIEGLLNSEYVFFRNGLDYTPVNVDTKSLEKLTGLNDNLISYSIDFKYSYDLVQNV